MSISNLSLSSEHSEALKQFDLLHESLPKYEHEKNQLLFHEKPHLESLYLSLVGKHKIELLEIQTTDFFLKRKLEYIQSSLNKNEIMNIEVIEILLEKEMVEHKNRIDTETKKYENAIRFMQLPPLSDEEAIELRSLYYKLVKRLHPDLNPDFSEEEKILWNNLCEAYQMSDLKKMQLLDLMSANKSTDQLLQQSNLDILKEQIEIVSKYITRMMKEIAIIKTNFPFTIRENLDNAEWIQSENNNTLNAISVEMDQKAAYEKMIASLLSK
jgi:hypothetical protein